ncbi:MAG: hypothetical protein SGBAC_012344 [Bacillariaceae sp.]
MATRYDVLPDPYYHPENEHYRKLLQGQFEDYEKAKGERAKGENQKDVVAFQVIGDVNSKKGRFLQMEENHQVGEMDFEFAMARVHEDFRHMRTAVFPGQGSKLPGNIRWKNLVKENAEEYDAAKTSERELIAIRLLDEFPGRFLVQNNQSKMVYEWTNKRELIRRVKQDFANLKYQMKQKAQKQDSLKREPDLDPDQLLYDLTALGLVESDPVSDDKLTSAFGSIWEVASKATKTLSGTTDQLNEMMQKEEIKHAFLTILRCTADQHPQPLDLYKKAAKASALSTVQAQIPDDVASGSKLISSMDGQRPVSFKLESKMDLLENVKDKVLKKGRWYSGTLLNSRPHGTGMLTYAKSDKEGHICEKQIYGSWNNGIPDGRVCVHYGTGDKFFGTFENNLRHGKGQYLYKDGAKYIGNFEKGVRHGRGAYTTPNKHKYDGKFVDGRFEGLGIHTFPGGRREFGLFQKWNLVTRYSNPQYEEEERNATGTAATAETGATDRTPTLNGAPQAVAAAGIATETDANGQSPTAYAVISQADSRFVMVEKDPAQPPTDRAIVEQLGC